jgi:hypothetical protein
LATIFAGIRFPTTSAIRTRVITGITIGGRMAEAAGSDRRTVEADRLPEGNGRRMAVAGRRAGRGRGTVVELTIRTGAGSRECREESLGIAMTMVMETGIEIREVAGVRLMSR